MGAGFCINGQKYISSKDACVASGYSQDTLLRLCLEKKIKSQRFKGGYFIEMQSLLKHIETRPSLSSVGTPYNLGIWHNCILGKFGRLITVATILLFILITPIFFLRTGHFSNYDITQTSSSYNSVSYLLNESDSKAMIVNVNNTAAVAIEDVVNTLCDGAAITFNKVREIILDIYYSY